MLCNCIFCTYTVDRENNVMSMRVHNFKESDVHFLSTACFYILQHTIDALYHQEEEVNERGIPIERPTSRKRSK